MSIVPEAAPGGYHEQDRSIPVRFALHPSITEAKIARLVERFYGEIRQDQRLGPIFDKRLAGRWELHLAKMQMFWQSVLLRNGAYKGKPLPAHLALKELVPGDYPAWLSIFRPVALDVFGPQAGPLVVDCAERIAQNLQLASFYSAGQSELTAVSAARNSEVRDA